MIALPYEPPALPSNEAAREAEIIRSGLLFIGIDPRLTPIVERARAHFRTAMAALTIVSSDWQYVIAAVGTAPGVFRRSTSFCAHAILEPERIFCVPDTAVDERFDGNPNVVDGDGIRFYAGAALVSGGLPLGALCVFDPDPRACLDTADGDVLRGMAGEAMATLRAVLRTPRPPSAG